MQSSSSFAPNDEFKLNIFCILALCRQPSLHRPFMVPLSTIGCVMMLAPALLLLTTMLVLPVARGQWHVIAFTGAALFLGACLYPMLQVARRRGWCEFDGGSPDDFKEHLYSKYSQVSTISSNAGLDAL